MLQGLSGAQIRERTDELLELFSLSEKRDAKLPTLSGGMRRALDIARGVLHRPDILFLDEPTLGLDVPSRRNLWRYIERVRRERNMTVFLTTHYLEEAEGCDRVVFLAGGRTVGSGAPTSLIDALGSYILEVEAEDPCRTMGAMTERFGPGLESGDKMIFRVQDASFDGTGLQADLDGRVRSVSWRRPTLNEVFLWTIGPGLDIGNP
jgi:ABC-2 type transport system ATP-binding protein